MMKSYTLLLFLTIILFSCQSSSDYLFEDELLECYYSQFDDGGKEQKEMLGEFEKLLIESGTIASSLGEGYYAFHENVVKDGDTFMNDKISPNIIDKARLLGDFHCSNRALVNDTLLVNQSKVFKIRQVMDEVAFSKDLPAVAYSKSILKHYTAQDFNHPVMKRMFVSGLREFYEPIEQK